jgi:hypothetical protein
MSFLQRYERDEAYVLCTASASTFEHPRAADGDRYEASHRLARWIRKHAQVKIGRIYPAPGEAIVVCRSAADADKLVKQLDKTNYAGAPVRIERLDDAAYAKLRGSVRSGSDKWSWKVMFPTDESFEWDQDKADAADKEEASAKKDHEHEGGCCGMRGGVANNQFTHPVTGHLMCIMCMNPIEPEDFNVCKPCASGIARPMWGETR